MNDEKIDSQNNIEAEKTPADFFEISSVRTYKGDVNDTVKGGNLNTAKILMAEQKKQENDGHKKDVYSIENNTNKLKLFAGVIFVVIAVIAVAYVVMNYLTAKNPVETQAVFDNKGKLFVIDKTESFDVTNKTIEEIKSALNNFLSTKFNENSVNEIVFYQTSLEESKKIETILNSASILKLLETAPPSLLKRSLSNDYIIGTFVFNSNNNKFVIFKLADFASAYDAMFSYEKDLVNDFREYFGGFTEFDSIAQLRKRKVELLSKDTSVINATSTSATSTATSTTPSVDEEIKNIDKDIENLEKTIYSYQNFIDIVLQNNDSRAVIDKDSNILFYYTFIDREWILFATNIEVLKEIKRRIREKNLVR